MCSILSKKGRLLYSMCSSFFYFVFILKLAINRAKHFSYVIDKWGASGIFVVLCKWDLKICYLHIHFLLIGNGRFETFRPTLFSNKIGQVHYFFIL